MNKTPGNNFKYFRIDLYEDTATISILGEYINFSEANSEDLIEKLRDAALWIEDQIYSNE